MAQTKAYVKIHSNANITVTPGLQAMDVTNKDAHVPDRLKVSSLWAKCTVDICTGAGWYPSEIAEWPAVKSLVRNKILTIGEYSDTPDDTVKINKEEVIGKVKEMKAKASLNTLAGE